MSGIEVNFVVFLITGVPQGILVVLATHLFTRTKINYKKFLLLSLIFTATTYLIRFLPIAIGVNTVLSLLVMIVAFQFIYKAKLSKIIQTIISTAVTFVLIAISEVINMMLLIAIYGQLKAEELFNSQEGLVRGLYTSPSNIFFVIFVFIGYLIIKYILKRKKQSEEVGAKTGA